MRNIHTDRPLRIIVIAVLAAIAVSAALRAERQGESKPATQQAAKPRTAPAKKNNDKKTQPTDDVEYWLRRAKPLPAADTSAEPPGGTNPFRKTAGTHFSRDDALPGVIELSDGRQLPGGLYTTRGKFWQVWVPAEKRWRRIPPAAVLSITAVVVREKMELAWRWKAMGEPEKVYTGRKYPFRRFLWRFHLADGSYLTGAVKGQPIWVESPGETHGPFVLHERAKGKAGQTLAEMVYVKKVVVSRGMMDKVVKAQASQPE